MCPYWWVAVLAAYYGAVVALAVTGFFLRLTPRERGGSAGLCFVLGLFWPITLPIAWAFFDHEEE